MSVCHYPQQQSEGQRACNDTQQQRGVCVCPRAPPCIRAGAPAQRQEEQSPGARCIAPLPGKCSRQSRALACRCLPGAGGSRQPQPQQTSPLALQPGQVLKGAGGPRARRSPTCSLLAALGAPARRGGRAAGAGHAGAPPRAGGSAARDQRDGPGCALAPAPGERPRPGSMVGARAAAAGLGGAAGAGCAQLGRAV